MLSSLGSMYSFITHVNSMSSGYGVHFMVKRVSRLARLIHVFFSNARSCHSLLFLTQMYNWRMSIDFLFSALKSIDHQFVKWSAAFGVCEV